MYMALGGNSVPFVLLLPHRPVTPFLRGKGSLIIHKCPKYCFMLETRVFSQNSCFWKAKSVPSCHLLPVENRTWKLWIMTTTVTCNSLPFLLLLQDGQWQLAHKGMFHFICRSPQPSCLPPY